MPPRSDIERAIARYQDEGLSGREGLRRFRAEGNRVTTFSWQQLWTNRRDEINEGIDPERMPEWGERHVRRQPMKLTRDPGRSRFFYWVILDIEEPDGTIRSDQFYGFDHHNDLTDRQAVRIAVQKWNAMMRRAPQTGSLTGVAIGGEVVAVAPLRRDD